jgi:quinol monooxygenase YgiN
MIQKALAVKLVAKPGKEAEVEAFLESGLGLVNEEPLTVTWYAVKFDDSTFAIFDTFDSDEGRDAHLNGKVAAALMANAAELLLEGPKIMKVDIIAAKTSRARADSSVA